MKGEIIDAALLALNVTAGSLLAMGHAPWYAFLFPGIGGLIAILRMFSRVI